MSDIRQKIAVWRQNALIKVRNIKHKAKRIKTAREYHEIDQQALSSAGLHIPWPEMHDIAKTHIRKSPNKKQRDDEVRARATCQRVTIYREAWLPNITEFREVNPWVKTEKH